MMLKNYLSRLGLQLQFPETLHFSVNYCKEANSICIIMIILKGGGG
jgi:hypothetical protein